MKIYAKMLNSVQLQACVLATAIFAAFLTTKAAADISHQVVLMGGASTVDSVSATWNQAEGGPLTGYEIECSEGVATPPFVNQTGFSHGPYTASCANLMNPGDECTMVVTRISYGSRLPPANISLTALPNSPVLEEGPETVNSVSATWSNPPGVVTAYVIGCNKGDAMPPIINQTGNGPFSASCVNLLTPGDQYIMNVTSLSGDQRSHRADIFLRAAPSQVTDLSELAVTDDSVSAMWTKPPGVVDGYTVICPDGSSMIEPENNDGSTHTVTCTGLTDPDGSYTILVSSWSAGKLSVRARVTIALNPHAPGTDAPTPTLDSATTSATRSAITATTESVSATTSPTTGTTMERAIPTPAPRLGLQYIIIIVVLLILLIVIAFPAVLLIFCRRRRKLPSDRTPLEVASHVNSVYQEIDEVPSPPPNIYDDIGDRTRGRSIENIYLEPDETGRGDHATVLIGASGGISESIKGKSEGGNDKGGAVAKSNDYVDLPVYLNGGVNGIETAGDDDVTKGSDYDSTIIKTPH